MLLVMVPFNDVLRWFFSVFKCVCTSPFLLKFSASCVRACVCIQTRYFEEFKRATMTVFSEDLDASRIDSTTHEGWRRLLQFIVDQLSHGLAELSDNCDQR